jgi:hypothetical protein
MEAAKVDAKANAEAPALSAEAAAAEAVAEAKAAKRAEITTKVAEMRAQQDKVGQFRSTPGLLAPELVESRARWLRRLHRLQG